MPRYKPRLSRSKILVAQDLVQSKIFNFIDIPLIFIDTVFTFIDKCWILLMALVF